MNIGGAGMLLRTVARAAGPAAGANPVTCGAASTAFCSACGGASQATHHSLRSSSCHHATVLQQQEINSEGHPLQVSEFEEEDWEFAEMSANRHPYVGVPSSPSSSLAGDINLLTLASGSCGWPYVFGIPPTFEEAQEATYELEMAISAARISDVSNATTGSQCGSPTESSYDGDNSISRATDWIEPRYMAECGSIQVPRHPVHEAFHLLQSDPHVKGAVISIVSDPDVWHAMMKNEKVQELKRLLQGSSKESVIVSEEVSHHDKHDWVTALADAVHSIVGSSKQIAFKVQEEICRIIRNIFGVSSKGWEPSSKDPSQTDDPVESTLKSSMALAMVVFAIVLLKRFRA